MSVDQRVLEIVWGETARLRPEGESTTAKARLQSVVGYLADSARGQGATTRFAKPLPLPPAGTPEGRQAADMSRVVEEAVTTAKSNGVSLPQRAVLWEVTAAGEPSETERQLPPWAEWIKDPAAKGSGDFTVEGDTANRRFRLYESDAEPGAGTVAFTSALTGSGIQSAVSLVDYWSAPWLIGFGSVLLFIWMAITLGWTGRSVTQAVDIIKGEQPVYAEQLVKDVQSACRTQPDACVGEGAAAANPSAETIEACATAFGPTTQFCRLVWDRALSITNSDQLAALPLGGWGQTLFGWATASPDRRGSTSIGTPLAGLLLSITLLCIAVGLGQTGRVFGIWISPQNRVSLGRMQVTLWTVVILGTYAAIALFNVGMLGELVRNAVAAGDEQAVTGLVTFPEISSTILALLGISVGTAMLSAVIKSVKPSIADAATGAPDAKVTRWTDLMSQGPLERRPSPKYASLADIFMGEQEDNKSQIDISRFQNVVITLILVCGYLVLIFGFAREATAALIIDHVAHGTSLFPKMPPVSGSFVTLVGVSQGTYLLTKAAQ